MKIRTKLIAILTVLSLAAMAFVGLSFMTFNSLDSDANFVNYSGRLRATSYRMAFLSSTIVKDNLINSDKNHELEETIELFDTIVTSLCDGNEELGLKELTDQEISSQLHTIQDEWEETFKPAYLSVLNHRDEGSLATITENIRNYVSKIDDMVSGYSQISQGKVDNSKTLSGVFLGVFVALVVFSLAMIQKGVIAPIAVITEELKNISTGNGDLTKVIEFKSNDEIGELTNYFNNFVASIKDIVVTISETAGTLTMSTDSISATSEELAKSTEMIANAVQEVSAGSVDQSDMVDSLTDLVNKMNSEIKQVIENAQNLLGESEASRQAADDGNATIQLQAKELEALVENTVEVSKTVGLLEQHSLDIQSILEIIDAISTQTNLLALNASIEAARAGEAGRGFSVVAEEIRKLAEETANSTVKIVEIVKNITEQTSQVSTHMDSMVDKIRIQEDSMADVQAKLDNIVEKSNIAYDGAKEIRDINDTISLDFTVIKDSANNISKVVETNSENTQDVAAAVEEQTASFEEVAANMNALNQLSGELKEVVARFVV